MNAEFEKQAKRIAAALDGMLEPGTQPGGRPSFLLSLPAVDRDAHLELILHDRQAPHYISLLAIFPYPSRTDPEHWPMPYREVKALSGVDSFFGAVVDIDADPAEVAAKVRGQVLPPYVATLILLRVALQSAPKLASPSDVLDRLVAASGGKGLARDDSRALVFMGEGRRVLALAGVKDGRVKLSFEGMSAGQAEAALLAVANHVDSK